MPRHVLRSVVMDPDDGHEGELLPLLLLPPPSFSVSLSPPSLSVALLSSLCWAARSCIARSCSINPHPPNGSSQPPPLPLAQMPTKPSPSTSHRARTTSQSHSNPRHRNSALKHVHRSNSSGVQSRRAAVHSRAERVAPDLHAQHHVQGEDVSSAVIPSCHHAITLGRFLARFLSAVVTLLLGGSSRAAAVHPSKSCFGCPLPLCLTVPPLSAV